MDVDCNNLLRDDIPVEFLEEHILLRELDGFEMHDEKLWENAEPIFSDPSPRSSCSSTEVKNIVIAVVGVTGSGKSTFIRTVSGRNDVIVGNNLTSETSEVRAYEFSHKNMNYTLIDTPGFDDTSFNDGEITELILNWLRTSFLEETRLNGVIYLHRICDPRMGGTALRNNRMFRKLCGEQAFKNVILATTFWENITMDTGESREKELREMHDFWGGMLQKGAKMVRLQRDKQSGLELIEQISTNDKVTLRVQEEMINQCKDPSDTEALIGGRQELEKMRRQQAAEMEAELRRMEMEQERARKEQEEKLKQELENLRRQREAERMSVELRRAEAEREVQIAYGMQLEEIRREREIQEVKMRREREELERIVREEQKRQRLREEAAAAERKREWREFTAQRKNDDCIILSLKNLRMFKKLCGPKGLSCVVLATTMWSQVPPEDGERRESELISNKDFWGEMVNQGSKIMRQDQGEASAIRIIQYIIGQRRRMVLDIQEEMASGKTLYETSAGRELEAELDRMRKRHEEDMRELREEMIETQRVNDKKSQEEIAAIRADLQKKLDQDREDRECMRVTMEELKKERDEELREAR
ncbi:hypothetical protein B7463_g3282, partial [Scytalidium lignicola]